MPGSELKDALENPQLLKLFNYWRDQAAGRPMPSRQDLDPVVDVPELVPNIFLVDVEHGPLHFRFRLVGGDIAVMLGRDITDMALEDLDLGDQYTVVCEQYERAAQAAKPTYCCHEYWTERGSRFLKYERLLLPLSEDGETVNMLLGGICKLEHVEVGSETGTSTPNAA